MMLFRKEILSGGLLLSVLAGACAPAGAAEAPEAVISKSLKQAFPDLDITRISPSVVPGLYEVMLGAELIYVTPDGRYLFDGDVLDLHSKENISEQKRAGARVGVLAAVPRDEMIEFEPPEPKYSVYVFTDISCGYCRRLHKDVPELNRLGIGVHYLAFPRMGTDSDTFKEMEAVWCAPDRKKALTDAKQGLPVKESTCRNPVRKQFELGVAMGVTGTPGVYTAHGRRLPGYMPPKELLKALQRDQ